jgi:hypothetical protein
MNPEATRSLDHNKTERQTTLALRDIFRLLDYKDPSEKEGYEKVETLLLTLEKYLPGTLDRFRTELQSENGKELCQQIESYKSTGYFRNIIPTFETLSDAQLKIIGAYTSERIFDFIWQAHGKSTAAHLQGIIDGCGEQYLSLLLQEDPDFLKKQVRKPNFEDLHYEQQVKDFYKPLYQKRQFIDGEFAKNPDITSFLKEHPEAVPFLRLRFQRALDLGHTTEDCTDDVIDLINKMENESGISLDSQYVPAIGVETEINEETPIPRSQEEYFLTSVFGVYDAYDEQWEFALPPSDARMQTRFVQELIKGDWLSDDDLKGNQYTMHLNIGVPKDVIIQQRDAGIIAYGLTAAYADEERLSKGDYGDYFHLKTKEGKLEKGADSVMHVDRQDYRGRLEIRALSLIEKTLYRTLFDASLLAAASFAFHKEHKDAKEQLLAKLWEDFEQEAVTLFKQIGLRYDLESPGEWKGFLAPRVVSIQPEMKKLVRKLTRRAAKIVSTPDEQYRVQEIPEAA